MAEAGCAGILVADTFCGPMRDLPREGQLLAIDAMPSKPGGCAANVAIGLARQGFSVDVAGCLGRDASASILLNGLKAHRVDCEHLVYTDAYPTSTTVILLVEGQDRRYIHVFGANKGFTVGQIDRDWLMGLKVFYFGGLFAMPGIKKDEFADVLKFCRENKVVTVVDVVLPHDFTGMDELGPLLPYIDYFLPNDDEARQITGLADSLDQIRAFQSSGANTVIITLGSAGAVAARAGKLWRSGIYQMEIKDPSGSGDAFDSGIITGILRGWDMPQTLRYASVLGASVTQAVGTTDGLFTAKEATAFLATHPMEVKKEKMA